MSENQPIDTEFEEINEEKSISGKPLYYTTSQVSLMLGITDSALRFYCTKFKSILNISMSGSHRRFREEDIEKLRYILKLLKEEKYTVNQVLEYAGEKDVKAIEKKIDNQEPLALQALATAIAVEIGGQIEEFKESLREQILQELREGREENQKLIKEELKNNSEDTKEYLKTAIQVEIKNEIGSIKTLIDETEMKQKDRDTELIDNLKQSMELQKLRNQEEEKKKGLFGRLFGK